MQVTAPDDRVDHAVITARRAREFTVSNSAEFIHVLSDTLYSDKPRAVVREVLCNAWDIHIVTGRTNIPVKVSLDDQYLTIQDFGSGIHDDLIYDIYCGYGNSTKKHDGNQTGGFGLGSKAPFAYAGNFEVTSCHQGVKTIYRASKSVAEMDGKPGMIPIVSIPSTEEGLTVKIPLKESSDRYTFEALIQEISRNGEMLVTLNGKTMDVYPFSTASSNWLIINKKNRYEPSIQVRYGNVIYPVSTHEVYADLYRNITSFFEKLPEGENLSITFMAEPNTISVTPSRESLSMSDMTVETIRGLLEEFHFDFNSTLERDCRTALVQALIKQYSTGKIAEFFEDTNVIMGVTKQRDRWSGNTYAGLKPGQYITDTKQIVSYFLQKNYPSFSGFHKFDLTARLDMLIANKYGDIALLKAYKKWWLRSYDRQFRMSNAFWARHIIAPIRLAAKADPLIGKIRLQVLEKGRDDYYRGDRDKLIEVETIKLRGPQDILPFLRKIVVVTHRTSDYRERAMSGDFKERIFDKLGTARNILVATAPRGKGKPEAIIAMFKKLGYEVIDLTIIHPWEVELITAKIETKEEPKAPPKPKGVLMYGKVIDQYGGVHQRQLIWNGDDATKKVINPEAVIVMSKTNNGGMNSNEALFLKRNFGTRIGVCVSTTQAEKYKKAGALDINEFIARQFLHYLQNHNSILAYLYYHPLWYSKIEDGDFRHIMEASVNSFALAKKLDLRHGLTPKDREWLTFWEAYVRSYKGRDYVNLPTRKQIAALLGAVPVPPELTALVERIKASKTLRFLDVYDIRLALSSQNQDLVNKLIGVRLLLTALKG